MYSIFPTGTPELLVIEYAAPSGLAQNYQGGVIYFTPGVGTFAVSGEIFRKDESMNRSLGYAASPQVAIKDGG